VRAVGLDGRVETIVAVPQEPSGGSLRCSRRKQIRRGTHRSTRGLEKAIRHYLAVYNEDPKPFVWTKTADEILASLARFCTRISGTGH
jgi:hypothetical protein